MISVIGLMSISNSHSLNDDTKTILLVEDEALIAINEAAVLKKHGYDVVTAYSGEKAVETVESVPEISLILMDIDLGDTGGSYASPA